MGGASQTPRPKVGRGEDPPPRLEDLEGKVVAELWDYLFEGDRAFPILRESFMNRSSYSCPRCQR